MASAVRVLAVDPDLAADLSGAALTRARQRAVADTHHVPQGHWPATRQFPTGPPATIGLLIVEGVVLREVGVGAHPIAELLGPGDLLRPWQREGEMTSVPLRTSWTVLEPMHLAILDRDFAQAIDGWPEISAALVCRAMTRAAYASFYLALTNIARLDDRLLGLLWGLADRWGRVQTAGVLVPFRPHPQRARPARLRAPTIGLTSSGTTRAARSTATHTPRLLAPHRRPATAGAAQHQGRGMTPPP